MTILQPHSRSQYSLSTIILGGLVIIAVVANIYFYSGIVNFRHLLGGNAKELQTSQVVNADLKNSLYKLLDFSNFKTAAEELRLVKDVQPTFLEIGISVAANQ